MQLLLEQMRKDADYQSLCQGLGKHLESQVATGMTGSLKAICVAALSKDVGRPICLITHTMAQAQKLYDDLQEIHQDGVYLYSGNDFYIMEYIHRSIHEIAQRLETIQAIYEKNAQVVVAPIYAAVKPISPPHVMKDCYQTITVDREYNIEELSHRLIELGYLREVKAEEAGHFSVRGGIIDFFPIMAQAPYRIEFFGDSVESIRQYDPLTQRSMESLESVVMTPCTEWPLSEQQLIDLGNILEAEYQQFSIGKDKKLLESLAEQLVPDIDKLKSALLPDHSIRYSKLLYGKNYNLLDYLSEDTIVIIDEPGRIMEKNKETEREFAEWIASLLESGGTLPGIIEAYDGNRVFQTSHQKILFPTMLRKLPFVSPGNIVSFVAKSAQEFHGQMNLLKQEVKRWQANKYHVVVLVANHERKDRVYRIFEDYKITGVSVKIGQLHSGFELPASKLVVLTETEIFGSKQRKSRRIGKQPNAERIRNYEDLKPGDYVVHVHHGIGKYVGIETLRVNDISRDYLRLQYAKNDALFVPIDQMGLIQKYIGNDESVPKIHSLGGSEWKRTKGRVKKAVRDIADELIKLYAERRMSKGFAFNKDSEWQSEFEAMFPYQETPDQLRSIQEIKEDMEKEYPMDRLLCGDVGYGKTEVAIRAAFKAVIDGKQVGVLVPTTILAQQHYENFKERFSGYPIRIAVLSRFRTKKEVTESLKALKLGELDIIIGTHRLLSKDVVFHDLGMLIIDEEQRFGVSHKEKIKQLKKNVDVLTLTATPIPRTLHMSLLGVRDLSLIETPPENRFPVETTVIEYNPIFIREVIEREVSRGGQVYFVYNRVEGIERMAEQLRTLIPDLRVTVGHGQMGEQQLEKVMLDFMDRQYDVLVSTTIIETGLDIPNVNTLIVYNADKMGLSQLYQLRGRVGRSNRVAYAYFTYQKDKVLTEVAEKRLQAICEFTELGSGFKIAMRDLAIRGAGNLLGSEQHGHIASVGFEMYNNLLSEAIEELKQKGNPIQEEKIEPVIDINVNAYLPESYVGDSMQKVELYKKMARIKELEHALELEEELLDRFGELPEEVELLLAITRIKSYCYKYRITHIEQHGNEIHMKLHPSENRKINGQQLFERASRFDNRIQLKAGQCIEIIVIIDRLSQKEIVELLEKWLYSYHGVCQIEEAEERVPEEKKE